MLLVAGDASKEAGGCAVGGLLAAFRGQMFACHVTGWSNKWINHSATSKRANLKPATALAHSKQNMLIIIRDGGPTICALISYLHLRRQSSSLPLLLLSI